MEKENISRDWELQKEFKVGLEYGAILLHFREEKWEEGKYDKVSLTFCPMYDIILLQCFLGE